MDARERILRDWFTITPIEWELIFCFQNKVCFICGKPNKSGKRLSTDHDHRDGLLRGLLCSTCNRILGKIEDPRFWRDNLIQKLERLLLYLKNPPAVMALSRKVFLPYPGKLGTKTHRAWLRKKNRAPINASLGKS